MLWLSEDIFISITSPHHWPKSSFHSKSPHLCGNVLLCQTSSFQKPPNRSRMSSYFTKSFKMFLKILLFSQSLPPEKPALWPPTLPAPDGNRRTCFFVFILCVCVSGVFVETSAQRLLLWGLAEANMDIKRSVSSCGVSDSSFNLILLLLIWE